MKYTWMYSEDSIGIGAIRCTNCGHVITFDTMFPVTEETSKEQKEHEQKCWIKDNPNRISHLI